MVLLFGLFCDCVALVLVLLFGLFFGFCVLIGVGLVWLFGWVVLGLGWVVAAFCGFGVLVWLFGWGEVVFDLVVVGWVLFVLGGVD